MIERHDGCPSNITLLPGCQPRRHDASLVRRRASDPAASAAAPRFSLRMAIAKVEPLTTARALRGPFDYRLPERLGEVGVGSVLLVPFGRRRVIGVVVGVAESSELPPERLAEPIEALAAGATPELVRLGLWVAREYCSTPARGLELVLPAQRGPGGPRGRDPGSRRSPPPPRPAGRRLATAPGWGRGSAARSRGWRASARRRRRALGAPARGRRGRPGDAGPPRGAGARQAPPRAAPAAPAGGGGRRPVEPAAAVGRAGRGGRGDRRGDGRRRRPRAPAPRGHGLGQDRGLPGGHRGGARAGEGRDRARSRDRADAPGDLAVRGAVRRSRGAAPLAAGGGRAPRRVAAPALGPGADLRRPALGGLRPGERARPDGDRRGARRLLQAGGRSALRRARGRPPPGARSGSGAARRQRHAPARELAGLAAARAAAPGRRPRAAAGRDRGPAWRLAPLGPASPAHAWRRSPSVREASAKAIVLLNRRGWSPFVCCRACGHAFQCPQCEVSLVLHKREQRLQCHHCGHAEPVSESCPECGSVALARHGAGTERLATLLGQAVAPLPVFRLDSDSAAGTRAATPRSCAASRRRSRAFWSAPRWSPRDTTSPMSC